MMMQISLWKLSLPLQLTWDRNRFLLFAISLLLIAFVDSANSYKSQYSYFPSESSNSNKFTDKFNDFKYIANFGTAQNQLTQDQASNMMVMQNEPQPRPTFQKVVYFGYPPFRPPMRRRSLFPYFFLGLAAGSAAVFGGAVAATALQG